MLQKYLCSLFICICVIGCTNESSDERLVVNRQTLEGAKPISVNPDAIPETFDLINIIESVRYIPLETRSDVMVGLTRNIKFDGKYIFLLDGKNPAAFVFDTMGNAIGQLGRHGKGLGEYGSPLDIRINPFSHNLDLYSSYNPHKIIKYDSNFNYADEIELADDIDGFFPIDAEKYLLIKHRFQFDDENLWYHGLNISQTTGKILNSFLPYQAILQPHETAANFITRNVFSTYENELSFFYHNGPAIYQVKNDSIVPKYKFEFSGYEFLADEIIPGDKEKRKKYIYNKRKTCCLEPVIETKNYIFFTYGFQDPVGATAIYSKKSGKLIQFKNYLNTFNDLHFSRPHGSYKGQLVFHVSTERLINILNNQKDFLIPEEAKKLEALVENLEPYGNPVIILYKLKDF